MHPIEAFKQLGLLSIILLALGLTFLVVYWPQDKHSTFSKHAAAHKASILYYVALFAVSLPILSLFFITWFVPTFHLSYWFLVFVISSELFQHSVTIIPEVGGWKTRWHDLLTGCSATLILPTMMLLVANSKISRPTRYITALGLLIMVSIATYQILFADKKQDRNQLAMQVGYYGVFFTAILAATY